MMFYLKAFLLVGLSFGVLVHFVTRQSMPWWPDTMIMGATGGAMATLSLFQHRRTRGILWNALKASFRRW
jgi:hypothetical protein